VTAQIAARTMTAFVAGLPRDILSVRAFVAPRNRPVSQPASPFRISLDRFKTTG
jgi:hypothetical protein